MNGKLIIIDGNSLINRAYYAIQRPMMTTEGLYTQGVYGFLNMLKRLIKEQQPAYLAVTFDRKAPTFRHLEYEEYKAGRKKMPSELAMQIPLMKEVLHAMNIEILEMDGFEADDIIGTVVKKAEEEGLESLVVTGDKDELQLATEKIRIMITKKGISEFEIYDHNKMVETYGFTPKQFIDFKGLMGDQSDNIPGIPGVGEKTAQKLILQYGSIENLLDSIETMPKNKMRERIEENAPMAVMSKRLATINVNVPIDFTFDALKYQEPDYHKLLDVYTKLEFNSQIKSLMKELNEAGISLDQGKNPIDPVDLSKENSRSEDSSYIVEKVNEIKATVIVDDSQAADNFAAELEKGNSESILYLKIFHDNNHRETPYISGINLLISNTFFYIPGASLEKYPGISEALKSYKGKIYGHDLKNDYYALMSTGIEMSFNTGWDTAIAQYILDPVRRTYDLPVLAFEYFHQEMKGENDILDLFGQISLFSDDSHISEVTSYGKEWLMLTNKLAMLFSQRLHEENLEQVYFDIELPLIKIMAELEYQGIKVDNQELSTIGDALKTRIDELTKMIWAMAGENFNINSPKQLGSILFEKLGLPPEKKTKTGYSTNAEVLEKLEKEHPIIPLVLEYRTLTKLNGTYVEGLLPLIHKDGKIHAHFQQTVTATGRLSCTEPNLQNIPIKQELGRTLRKAFVSNGEDSLLVGADYSQIELRILAHLSEDPALIEAFHRNKDIHRITASKVFGIPEENVTPIQRSNAKAVNFGVIYGMSSFGLSTGLNITRKEAEDYINEYFRKYEKVKLFMDRMIADCKRDGYVTTISGRKRKIPEISASNYNTRQLGERLAMNTPIQGSAADIIKLAMLRVSRRLQNECRNSHLILQVHDELIINTKKDELEKVKEIITESMEGAYQLLVPLVAEVKTGENWFELK